MNTLIEFSKFFTNPNKWATKIIKGEERKNLFILNSFIITLCALSNYIALFKVIIGKSYFPIVLINSFFFIIIYALVVFIDISITNFFIKKEINKPLTNSKIYTIISSSYYPYIFLSVISNIEYNIIIHLIMSIIITTWSIKIRKKIIKEVENHFIRPAWIVSIMPIIIQTTTIIFIIGLTSSLFISNIINSIIINL